MQQTLAFPRPGPALKGLLITVGVLGIGLAILGRSPIGGFIFETLACFPPAVLKGQVWRLVTSGLLTSPDSYGHLIFTLLGLYFLSTDLERRWGGARLLLFLGGAVLAGNLLATVIDRIAPAALTTLHVRTLMFGPEAALSATAVAWAGMNADRHILLFFVVPVRGKYLTWVTLGFCVLGVIYPGAPPAGHVAPFGGFLVGLFFGGAASPGRRAWLTLRLWFLRRRLGSDAPTAAGVLKGSTGRRRGGPALRVVPGGQSSDKPPKDKRYLN